MLNLVKPCGLSMTDIQGNNDLETQFVRGKMGGHSCDRERPEGHSGNPNTERGAGSPVSVTACAFCFAEWKWT